MRIFFGKRNMCESVQWFIARLLLSQDHFFTYSFAVALCYSTRGLGFVFNIFWVSDLQPQSSLFWGKVAISTAWNVLILAHSLAEFRFPFKPHLFRGAFFPIYSKIQFVLPCSNPLLALFSQLISPSSAYILM